MLAHGFPIEQMVELVRADLADHIDLLRSSNQQSEQIDMIRFKRGLSSSARWRLIVGKVIAPLASVGVPPVRSASSISSKFL